MSPTSSAEQPVAPPPRQPFEALPRPAGVDEARPLSPAVHTIELRKQYRRTVALEGISMTVKRGEVFGFLGPNGAGKTTAVKLLLGLVRPTGGEAMVLGAPAGDVETRRQDRLPAGAVPVPGLVERPRGAAAALPAAAPSEPPVGGRSGRSPRHSGALGPGAGQGGDLLEGDAAAPRPRRRSPRGAGARRAGRADERPRPGRAARGPRDHRRAP